MRAIEKALGRSKLCLSELELVDSLRYSMISRTLKGSIRSIVDRRIDLTLLATLKHPVSQNFRSTSTARGSGPEQVNGLRCLGLGVEKGEYDDGCFGLTRFDGGNMMG